MLSFPRTLVSKLPKAGTTIFATMSALAAEHHAINLSQGFPNFETSPELISLVNEYMKKGMNQYAPMQGVMKLRETIAEKMKNLYGAGYNPETEVTITSGGTQAIYTALAAVVHEGDEVIVIEPAYDSYIPAIEMHGGIPVTARLQLPDYHIDWKEIKNLVTPRTRMILINTPHNPTGAVMTTLDMKELEKIVADTDIIVLSDEVYEHIIFDNQKHESVCRYPKLAERSFIVFSFGKTYHTTGWKMGYCLAPADLMTEFRKVHQFMVFCANTPVQHALNEYMKKQDMYLGLPAFYQEKRDYFAGLLSGSKFKFTPAKGSYFQLLDYSTLSDERDIEFAIRMTKEYGVASIPVSGFYLDPVDHKLLRFCFAKTKETLEMAAERLMKIA